MAEHSFDIRMKYIKYTLLAITTILVLFSAVIITLGTSIYGTYQYLAYFLYHKFYYEAIFTIVIGAIILAVSLFGSFAAFRESTCLINTFSLILTLLVVLELYAVVVAFNMWERMYWMLNDNLRRVFKNYNYNYNDMHAFDRLQHELQCCGLVSYKDWDDQPPADSSSNLVLANVTVPYSCCAVFTQDMHKSEVCSVVASEGCLYVLEYTAYQALYLVGAAALTVGFIQVIGVVASWLSLVKSISRIMSDRSEMKTPLVNNQSPNGDDE